MSIKSDENRDEEIQDEEVEDTDTAEAEDSDSDSEEEEDVPDEEEESDDTESKGFAMPDKFKGKSAEEIAKSYTQLEGMINEKALEMAQQFLVKKGVETKTEDTEESDEDFDIGLSDEEISRMSPKEFARHLNRKITERATEIARNAIERSNEVKESVSKEIKEATKSHPHLKENNEYRDVVLSLIEAASANGKIMTLKEACEKADRAMNIKPEQVESPKKKLKTAVEKQDGSDGKPVKSDEDRVREGMMNAGMSTGFLGGLGV